jgi:hypothetical protein
MTRLLLPSFALIHAKKREGLFPLTNGGDTLLITLSKDRLVALPKSDLYYLEISI